MQSRMRRNRVTHFQLRSAERIRRCTVSTTLLLIIARGETEKSISILASNDNPTRKCSINRATFENELPCTNYKL
jgi:hypothetical protein